MLCEISNLFLWFQSVEKVSKSTLKIESLALSVYFKEDTFSSLVTITSKSQII